jgi:PAS domain-containing protein
MRRIALATLAALVLAPAAAGSNAATAKMAAVACWAAAKPVSVWCENDPIEWARILAAAGHTRAVQGYAVVGGSEVWIGPAACNYLGQESSTLLGVGLNALLHESWHARGHRDEAFAECAARVLIYSALHDF